MAYIFSFIIFSLVGILISIGDETRNECIKRERDKIWHRNRYDADNTLCVKREVGTLTLFDTYILKAIIYLVWGVAVLTLIVALYMLIF